MNRRKHIEDNILIYAWRIADPSLKQASLLFRGLQRTRATRQCAAICNMSPLAYGIPYGILYGIWAGAICVQSHSIYQWWTISETGPKRWDRKTGKMTFNWENDVFHMQNSQSIQRIT